MSPVIAMHGPHRTELSHSKARDELSLQGRGAEPHHWQKRITAAIRVAEHEVREHYVCRVKFYFRADGNILFDSSIFSLNGRENRFNEMRTI